MSLAFGLSHSKGVCNDGWDRIASWLQKTRSQMRHENDKKTIILQFYNKYNELSFQSLSSISSGCLFCLSTHNLNMILINPVNKDFYGQFTSVLRLINLFVQLSYNSSLKALFNTKLIDLLNCLRSKVVCLSSFL